MMKLFGGRKSIFTSSKKRSGKSKAPKARPIRVEALEPRRLLSTVGLSIPSSVTLAAGTSTLVALKGSDTGQTVQFGVTSSDATKVAPSLMPSTNPSLQFNIANVGTMTFQLFANLTPNTVNWIKTLVNDGLYNGDYIYRAETGSFALIQGGNNPPQIGGGADVNPWPASLGSTTTTNEEFNPDLNYTSAGALAMARTSAPNSSSSEFFVTDGPTRTLDYAYSLFGFQTGDNPTDGQTTSVLQQLDAMPTTNSGGINYLNTPVKITSASIIADTQNGVLMLRAPAGVTGSFTVAVTAYDGTNTPTTQDITVNVVADTATGNVTNPWASKTPAAPTAVAFQPPAGLSDPTVTAENNSSSTKALQFQVSGTTSGDNVTVYADGVAIGSTVAATGTTVVTTNGSMTLSAGSHTFTATQTAPNQTVADSGDSSQSETANVDSYSSPAVQVQVVTSLAITSAAPATTATAGQVYSYKLQTSAPAGDAISVSTTDSGGKSTVPAGMTFDSATSTFTWTPSVNQEGTTQSYNATITDSAGNTATLGPIQVTVASNNVLTVIGPSSNIAVGSPVLVGFNDSNSSANNFTVTTSDPNHLTATLTPNTNSVLKVVTNLGEMDFQLLQNLAPGVPGTPNTVQHFEDLVNSGAYNPSSYTNFTGTFQLDLSTSSGTTGTAPITFNAANPTATAANIQAALINIGITGTVVTVDATSAAPNYKFNITFPSAVPNFGYVPSASPLPVTFSNSATSSSATQTLTFTAYTPSFYRVIQSFMEQGGVIGSGIGSDIPVELNKDLRFTSTGLLAMANNGVDGNSSEFFVTDPTTTNTLNSDGSVSTYADMGDGFLDFRYTIFGKLISGDSVRQAIADTQVTANGSGENSLPTTPITIESMSIGTDPQAGVFSLKALSGATGTYTVTVSDGLGNTQTFSVNASDPTTNAPITNKYDPPNPWVAPINGTDKITTPYNTAYTFTPQGMSADGSAVTVKVELLLNVPKVSGAEVDGSFASTSTAAVDPPQSPNPNFTLTQNGSSWTITPTAGFYGVQFLEVTAESATAAAWDAGSGIDPIYRAFVPVYVSPPSPTLSSITSTASGQTITGNTFNNNSSAATKFNFNITGVVSGATVAVFDNGGTTPIATGTATGTTITLTTDGATKFADGSHSFTVAQTIGAQSLTAYVNWSSASGNDSPGTQFSIPSSTVQSAASGGTPLTVGLALLAQPVTSARAGNVYSFIVQTNAPSTDAITVTPITLPPGMVFDGSKTFTWTPTAAQLNSSLMFEATVSDSAGRTVTIGPVNIAVILGLAPAQVPLGTSGGDVTVKFSGNNVLVYNNLLKSVLSFQSFKSTDTLEIDLPTGQANSVLVMLPASSASMPMQVFVNGTSGGTNNQVTVFGTSAADTFNVTGNTATSNGLQVTSSNVQKLTLAGMGGDNDYILNSSSMPTWIVNTGNQGTLDFSHDTAGVKVNLGLSGGQGQAMSGWNTSLMLYGVMDKIIGTQFADTLTGGSAATTYIHSGAGNDTIMGGSGNNILVGGGGNDTITGGKNSNLLIAGSGTTSLYALGSVNMVFGGSSSYDNNDQALIGLLNQGPTLPFTYSVRRALASAGSNASLLSSLIKFQDSGAHDIIFSNGSSDWFVPGKNGVVKHI